MNQDKSDQILHNPLQQVSRDTVAIFAYFNVTVPVCQALLMVGAVKPNRCSDPRAGASRVNRSRATSCTVR